MKFAGGGQYDFFVERVDLRLSNGTAVRALERWKELEREGWDVTAVCAVDDTHMIGLGCLYEGQVALRVCA